MSEKRVYDRENVAVSDVSKPEDTQRYYDTWGNKYDEDMEISDFQGPKLFSEAFLHLGLPTSLKILDLLAGTGKLAELVRPHGYTNIDAIDGSEVMLKHAKDRQLYNNYFHALLGPDSQAPISDETYDAIISCGGFCPGHLYPDIFPELLRIVNKGGLICWAMRDGYGKSSARFATFDDEVEKLVQSGSWEHFRPRETVNRYWLGSAGFVYIMKQL